MAEAGDSATETLSDLRKRIDAIDAEMHRLLIERGSVIDALIEANGTGSSRVAFRPQREAEMMRRLVERHHGSLPLASVEHLWHEIITTFTFMQAPFRLIVHYGTDPVAIHDLARFAFGFSVDLVRAEDPDGVVAMVASTGSDLGLIPIESGRFETPWWRALSKAGGPQVMALYPFVAGKRLPADAAAAIISPQLHEPTTADLAVWAAADDREPGSTIPGATLIAECAINGRREALLAITRNDAASVLAAAGTNNVVEVGGIATGLTLSGESDGVRIPAPGTAQ